MQVVNHLPLIFLTLLAGCTEQLPGISRVADPVPIVETQTPVWARVLATPDVSCHSANEYLARAW